MEENKVTNLNGMANENGKSFILTVKKVLTVFSLLCTVMVFCPSFLVSCSGQDLKVSAMTAVGGVSLYGENIADPQPIMLICLFIPLVILVILFTKKITGKKKVGIILGGASADLVIWFIFRLVVKKFAEENYCTFSTTGWFVLNIFALILIITMTLLVVFNKIGIDADLISLFSGGGTRGALNQMTATVNKVSDAVTQLAGNVASNIGRKSQKENAIGYCAKCGSPILYDCKFCTSCGTPVPESMLAEAEAVKKATEERARQEAESQATEERVRQEAENQTAEERARQEAQPAPAPKNADEHLNNRSVKVAGTFLKTAADKIKALPKMILAGAGVALIALIVIIGVAVNVGSTINLNNYLIFETNGYDGYGTASAYIDWAAVEEKYGDKLSFTKQARDDMGEFTNMATPFEVLRNSINVRLEEYSGLSNGMEIDYTWEIDGNLSNYVKYRAKYADDAFMVSDLAEVGRFDGFAGLDVTFSGIEPNGVINVNYNGSDLSIYDFTYDQSGGLSNGDPVIISLENLNLDYYAQEYGRVPQGLKKEYKVTGLSSYLTQLADIGEAALASMQQQAADVFASHVAQEWDESEAVESFTYLGNYLLTAKESDFNWGPHSTLYLVYKIQIRNTYANGEGESYDQLNELYWYISFSDLLTGADGNLAVDVLDYETPGDQFSIDSGISTGWFSTQSWSYRGYRTLDELYKTVVVSRMDAYNHEDNVDESAAPEAIAAPAEASAGDMAKSGYMLPNSAAELLEREALTGLSANDCKIARNEIYARHGRKFQDAELQAYFETCAWYEGTIEPEDFNESVLSDIEMANKDLIVAYEEEQGYQ